MSFQNPGALMWLIPLGGAIMRPLLSAYRDAWKTAGHPGGSR